MFPKAEAFPHVLPQIQFEKDFFRLENEFLRSSFKTFEVMLLQAFKQLIDFNIIYKHSVFSIKKIAEDQPSSFGVKKISFRKVKVIHVTCHLRLTLPIEIFEASIKKC